MSRLGIIIGGRDSAVLWSARREQAPHAVYVGIERAISRLQRVKQQSLRPRRCNMHRATVRNGPHYAGRKDLHALGGSARSAWA
jgi:hypothetical protein